MQAADQPFFKNIGPDEISVIGAAEKIPGRGDLRISLTTSCNLRCAHCHNEGQPPPWQCDPQRAPVSETDIEDLISVAHHYGAKSVKFTGGEPAVHPNFLGILRCVERWREAYPGIKKWGISTNGTPFLSKTRFAALADSALDNVCIGIDSLALGDKSKPSSAVGVSGRRLFDHVVVPLAQAWQGQSRNIKVNVVYTGDSQRVKEVVEAAFDLGVNVSVIEINGVMGDRHDTRMGFLALINDLAEALNLVAELDQLNEICLVSPETSDKARVRFYQDHCADMDCGNCRKIHMRINPSEGGWAAIPCFLKAQAEMLPIVEEGRVSPKLFSLAARLNGTGPDWRKWMAALSNAR